MDFVIKGRSSIFAKEEVTEGVYNGPTSSLDAIEVLEDFSGFEYTRESIERAVLSATVESEAPRTGLPSVVGTLPTEFKAGAVEGSAPRSDVFLKSLLGGKRSVVGSIALEAGSTTTVLNLDDADANKVNVGDSILVKIPGAHEFRPVSEVDNTLGAVTVTLAIPLSSAPVAGVQIAPLTTYYYEENNTSFSVGAEMGGEITEKASGCKVESAEISNWTTGQIPQISFAIKALGLDKVDTVSGYTPDFSTEPQPPVALDACAYFDQEEVDYNEFGMNIANTLNELLSACASQGKIATRNTKLLVTGNINPYMKADSVDRFQKFNNNNPFSFFIHIANPGSVAGEYQNGACIWLPQAVLTSITNGDQDGVLTDDLEFQAYKKNGNDTIFISFI
jgi:hypothetical protein